MPAPDQVTGLVVTSPRFHVASLTWTAPGDGGSAITDYVIEHAPDSSGSPGTFTTISDGVTNATFFDVTNTSSGVRWYRVSAVNAIGTGTASAPVSVPVRGTVSAGGAAVTASRTHTATFSGGVATDDVIVFWGISGAAAGAITVPAGWENPLGGNTVVASDSHTMACVAHRVTLAENGLTSISCTNLWNAAITGAQMVIRVKGVDPTTMLMAGASSFSSTNTATPHVLAGIAAGSVTADYGYVVSCVASDGLATYTVPGGWTGLASFNTNNGTHALRNNTLTTQNNAVAATNITPSAGDEYASITVILRNAPAAALPSRWKGRWSRPRGSFNNTSYY